MNSLKCWEEQGFVESKAVKEMDGVHVTCLASTREYSTRTRARDPNGVRVQRHVERKRELYERERTV
jgi:hypothetical protein